MKERVRFYGIVDFPLEDGDEAGFAELLVVLGADYEGPGCVAKCAGAGRHDQTTEGGLLNVFASPYKRKEWKECCRFGATGSLDCRVFISMYERKIRTALSGRAR